MKKLNYYLVVFLIFVIFTVAFTSCDLIPGNKEQPKEEEHIHNFVITNTDSKFLKSSATCSEPAVYYYSCQCLEIGTDTFVRGESLGHDWKEATCLVYKACKRCGEVTNELADHIYTDGVCTVCGANDPNYEEPHTHSYDATVIDPTCVSGGCTVYTCDCGDSYVTSETAPLGHKEVIDSAVEPTCTEDGLTEGKHCSVCNEVLVTQEVVESPGHDHKGFVTDPTCTEGGYTTYTCHCGDTYVSDEKPSNGHKYVDMVCTSCGKIFVSEGLDYKLSDDMTYYSVRGIGDCEDKDIVIPAVYNDLPVTAIESYAFIDCSDITSVLIPEGVLTIGNSAFYGCTALESVSIPNSILTLNDDFDGIDSLKFNEYDGAYYLGNKDNMYLVLVRAKDTSITSCTVNEKTKIICRYAFASCSELVQVDLPDGLISIGMAAFVDCHSLVEIVIPDTITVIDSGTFARCYKLTFVTLSDNLIAIRMQAFMYCNLVSITLPENLEIIEQEAFESCFKLVEVINASKSLQVTPGSSDYGKVACYAKSVGNGLGLSSVDNVDGYLFFSHSGTNYLLGYVGQNTSLILPESYNGGKYHIYERAFEENSMITDVVIPDAVLSIGSRAFKSCANLTSVTISNGVATISDYAFAYSPSLTISCEAESKPAGWDEGWNYSNEYNTNTIPVIWGVKES